MPPPADPAVTPRAVRQKLTVRDEMVLTIVAVAALWVAYLAYWVAAGRQAGRPEAVAGGGGGTGWLLVNAAVFVALAKWGYHLAGGPALRVPGARAWWRSASWSRSRPGAHWRETGARMWRSSAARSS